jgi:hypothetical protein
MNVKKKIASIKTTIGSKKNRDKEKSPDRQRNK